MRLPIAFSVSATSKPMTTEELVSQIIDRELHHSERGKPWAFSRARLHAADKGGWTRGGITAASWGRYKKFGRSATPEELNAIGEADARQFYRERYVGPFAFLADPLKALMVDWAVTSGHDDPAKALQATLKRRGIYDGIIDGVVGPKTRRALIEDPSPRTTYTDVYNARVRFYVNLAMRDPAVLDLLADNPRCQLWNLRGWVNRALEFSL